MPNHYHYLSEKTQMFFLSGNTRSPLFNMKLFGQRKGKIYKRETA